MIVDGHEMTASHSEAEIYKGCIALMQELTERFTEYMAYVGIEPKPEDDEERFWTSFYPTQIVERLFLWGTSHSGGTSQRMKCRELGIDDDEKVVFEDARYRDDECGSDGCPIKYDAAEFFSAERGDGR